MYKAVNIFFFLLVLFFFGNIYIYYSSKMNIKVKESTRNNIDQIIKKKITNIPILENDTNNVIEFNNSISGQNLEKPRSFWKLLK